mmetsp:Transcript_23982/g.32149  ORF Transcript_23982/g.32149 Transcript_23982/m.32149 type:complete len:85 (+) Transcript_23982:1158-1412(+)
MWHYERFANHDKARNLAFKQLPVLRSKMNMLHDLKGFPAAELEFLVDGYEAVIKCREILKWTYAFGFYKDKNMVENRKLLFQQW